MAASDSTGEITGYHAHVYYDEASRERATRLRDAIGEAFDVTLGRWHDRPVGPHPRWSYQVAFEPGQFAAVIPFIALNRDGLTIFVHPNTGHDLEDHRDYALWMGELLELDLDVLR